SHSQLRDLFYTRSLPIPLLGLAFSALNDNDPTGVIDKYYTAADNFGIGPPRSVQSDFNPDEDYPYPSYIPRPDHYNDFELTYSITDQGHYDKGAQARLVTVTDAVVTIEEVTVHDDHPQLLGYQGCNGTPETWQPNQNCRIGNTALASLNIDLSANN